LYATCDDDAQRAVLGLEHDHWLPAPVELSAD
jgi:hypothetical protein